MADLTYKQQTEKKYIMQLRDLLKVLPSFCTQFFIGIDTTTAPRTRLAYATDLKNFFEYIKLNYEKYSSTDIHDYPLELLTELKPADFEQYIQYVKLYVDESGKDVINNERDQT